MVKRGDKDIFLASESDTELPVYSPIEIQLPASTCNVIVLPKFSPPRHEKVALPKCKCTATPKSSPSASPSRLPDARNQSSSTRLPRSPTDLSSRRSSGQGPSKNRSSREPSPRGRSPKDSSPKDRSPIDRSPTDRSSKGRSSKGRSSKGRSPKDRSPKDYSPNERSSRDRSPRHSPLQTSAPSPPKVSGGGSPRASGGIPKAPRGGSPKVSGGGWPRVSRRGSPKPNPEGSRDALASQAATQIWAGIASSRRPKTPVSDASAAPPRSPAHSPPKVEPKAPPKIRSKSPPRRPPTPPPNDLPSIRGPRGHRRPNLQKIFHQISKDGFQSQCQNPRDPASRFYPPLVSAPEQQPHDPLQRQSPTRLTPMPEPEPSIQTEDPHQFFNRMSKKLMAYFLIG
nr:PREDICTED: serine/arginine repetitive matrix protein 1-like [Bemisia tabaci]